MVAHRLGLVGALRAAERLTGHVQARPLDYIRWTPPQHEFLNRKARRKLFRAGNQIGKTITGLAEIVWWCTGTHPFVRTIPPPVEAWIVCTTWPQSVNIMKKLWSMLPKHLLKPGQSCGARYGFGKDNPAVVFTNGSIIRFKTTEQGPEALAGSTVHVILIDEPTDEDVYRELERRVMRTGGTVLFTLTPINRPTEYLRQLVRDGVVEETWARLTPENLIPVGCTVPLRLLDGTPMDQVWIDQQRASVLRRFAPVVLDGEWECRTEGSVFSAYDPETHFVDTEFGDDPRLDLKVCVGFDWGEGDFRSVEVTAGIDTSGEFPRVHFLSEFTSDGTTLPEEDAAGTLASLDEAGGHDEDDEEEGGWTWSEVYAATGDKPTTGKAGRKSNADLTAALERALRKKNELGRRQVLTPPIRTAKTGRGGGAGSVWQGVTWLHRAMLRPGHFTVHPRCERLHESLQKWDYSDNEWKDAIDAARYATWPFAMRGQRGVSTGPIYVVG